MAETQTGDMPYHRFEMQSSLMNDFLRLGSGGEPDPPDSPPVPVQDPPSAPHSEPSAPVREPGPTPPTKR